MVKIITESKVCSCCNKNKKTKDNYYMTHSAVIHSDGRLGICKLCLESAANFEDVESFVDILRQIDRPFLRPEYEASKLKGGFGEYMRRLAMRQNRTFTYLDSVFEGTLEHKQAKSAKEMDKKILIKDVVNFKVTPAMVTMWGNGYNESDIFQLQQFFNEMKDANSISTPQHKEQLKLLCKVNLEQNKALEEKRFGEFKTLNQQYNNILRDSGFRPIDKQSGGESVGIRTFSQIWEEIERDGFIEPYPYEEKQDIIDKTIMYMGNYTRKLLNMQSMSEPPDDTPLVDEGEHG